MPAATYTVSVDWDKNGNYSGTYDDITAYVRSIRSFNGFRAPFNNVAGDASLEIELDNSDKRFSPEYSSGPLYGKKWLNVPSRYQANNGSTYTLWTGWVTSIQPQTASNGEKRAVLSATGARRELDSTKVYLPLQIGQRTDQAIQALLDQVYIPESLSAGPWALGVTNYTELGNNTYIAGSAITTSFEAGLLTPSYVGDTWNNGVTAYEGIKQLTEAERGRFFFNRSGQAIFYNRAHFALDITDDFSLTDADVMQHAYVYGAGDDIVNRVIVRYKPRTIGAADAVLWQLDKPVTVPAGSEKKINARFTEQSSDSQISGYNIKPPSVTAGSITFSSGTCDLASWSSNARGAEMVFVARAGDCTISGIVIYGNKLTAYNQAEAIALHENSPFFYGRHELVFDLPVVDTETDASSIAEYEVSRRPLPYGRMASVTLINKSTAILANQLSRTIGDRVNIAETQTAHNADYFIIGEEHVISDGMKKHVTTWFLEPASTAQYWTLGTSGYSELGTTTKVGPG